MTKRQGDVMRKFLVGSSWLTSLGRAAGSCAILAVSAASAMAQSAPPGTNAGTPNAPKHATGPRLEEVVVTAQRRKQTLEQAPVAVTYISPATTKNLDIRTVHDLSLVTPSLSFSAQDDFAMIYIRGIGTNYANPGLETPVAIYEDGVYQTAGNNNILNLMDPGSVQVLNGPQGTLYGRNASGGVLLFNTADPVHQETASIAGEYGSYNHQLVDVMINQPLSPDLVFRGVARFLNDGGYIHNEYDGKSLAGGETKELRGKLLWTPSAIPGLSVLASTEYSYTDEHHDYSGELLQAPLCLGCSLGAVPPVGFYNVNQDGDGVFVEKNWLDVLRVTYDLGPYSIKNVLGYRYASFGGPGGSDQDYTTIPLFQFHDFVPGRTLTESLQLSTNYTGPFNFITGVDYINDRRSFFSTFDGLAFAPYEVGPYAGTVPQNASNVRTDSESVFLEANYKVTPKLTFTAGARYNIDQRTLDTQNNPLSTLLFANSGFIERVSYYSFTPRGVITYQTPFGNLYVSETKGFKAGGLNTPAFSEAPVIAPEKVRSEEIGLKSRLLNGRLQTTIDGFHYVDNGLQVQVTDVDAGGSVTKNAASSEGYGIEATGRFAVTDDLILGAGLDWLHARFTSYPNPSLYCPTATGLVNCSYNISGSALPHAPNFSGYLTAEYSFPIINGFHGSLAVAAHYTTQFDFIAGQGGPLALDQQKAYALVNINGWVTPPNGRYRVGFYLDNATNTEYNDFVTTAGPYGAYHQAAPPIEAGLKLQVNFDNW
jgi:iron complex outermembrane receptor protein